jgi:hypothetical protein
MPDGEEVAVDSSRSGGGSGRDLARESTRELARGPHEAAKTYHRTAVSGGGSGRCRCGVWSWRGCGTRNDAGPYVAAVYNRRQLGAVGGHGNTTPHTGAGTRLIGPGHATIGGGIDVAAREARPLEGGELGNTTRARRR